MNRGFSSLLHQLCVEQPEATLEYHFGVLFFRETEDLTENLHLPQAT